MSDKVKEVYFALAMAIHVLILSFYTPVSAYISAFSSALTLPVMYVLRTKEEYEFKGKYFKVRKPLLERLSEDFIVFTTAIMCAFVFYMGTGHTDIGWFLVGFTSAMFMRYFVFSVVYILKKVVNVERPYFILPVGIGLGVLYTYLVLPLVLTLPNIMVKI